MLIYSVIGNFTIKKWSSVNRRSTQSFVQKHFVAIFILTCNYYHRYSILILFGLRFTNHDFINFFFLPHLAGSDGNRRL